MKGYREVARELAAARQMLTSQLAPVTPAKTVQTSFYKSVVGTRYTALHLRTTELDRPGPPSWPVASTAPTRWRGKHSSLP